MNSASEIKNLALKLPERSRLKLAGELLRSMDPVVTPDELLAEAERRESEIENGTVRELSESEFWNGVRTRGSRA